MNSSTFRVQVRNAALECTLVQPALISWYDRRANQYQHLGRVSDSNDGKANLTLWIGHDVDIKRQTLINFHIPVNTRTSKQKSVKDMYLVVPVEDLRLTVNTVSVEDIPYTTLPHLRRDGLETSDVFVKVTFVFGQDHAYVAMPDVPRKMQKPLTGAPLQMVSQLRMLSETGSFDVYLAHGTTCDQLEALYATLQRNGATSAEVDLEAMYGRGRVGKTNIWEQYSCGDVGQSMPTWNPIQDDAPPPYEEVVEPSPH